MNYSVQKLDQARAYGAVVQGLTEASLVEERVREDLRALWIEHGLIIFKGEVSESFHVALSKVFGKVEPHPVKEVHVPGFPELMNISYDPQGAALWEVGGELLGGWLPWHFDLIYLDKINHGGILRAITLPSAGGETGFIDRIEAYETLPDDLKSQIENLRIVYKLRIDFSAQRYSSPVALKLVRSSKRIKDVTARQDVDFPPVVHPVVYRQPETGRKVLNVSPTFAEYILGMDNEEGHALLQRLVNHVADIRRAVYHKWAADEMVLWDNWRTLHSCKGVAPDDTREMQRTTISGDYALGAAQ
jgi:taurine dioxygenase